MTGVARRWVRDLALGFRLAVGGSRNHRTSWVRLGVGAFGIALAVAVLLGAASAGSVTEARAERTAGQMPVPEKRPGAAPTYLQHVSTEFDGTEIGGELIEHADRTSPVPPGVPRQLEPGEMVVSPALAELLDDADSGLLRERFADYRVVGLLGKPGLGDPQEYTFVGASDEVSDGNQDTGRTAAYGFGGRVYDPETPPEFLLLILLGGVVMIVPLLIFIQASSRIAGAERDRRLAAVRLVGADARQVRRIAAAEALLPAGVGLLAGGGLFLALRPLVGEVRFIDMSVFAEDIVPAWWGVVLVVVAVPLLALGTALVSMRRAVIEPLGVARQSAPRRKRALWWRLSAVVIGVGLLVTARDLGESVGVEESVAIVAGAALMVLGVASLLPWAVERAIGLFRGGPATLQLAARRLQVDAGTSSRVVSGIVVVLTGAVAVLVVMASAEQDMREFEQVAAARMGGEQPVAPDVSIIGGPERADEVQASLAQVDGLRGVHRADTVVSRAGEIVVGDCFALRTFNAPRACEAGDVFLPRMSDLEGRTGQLVSGDEVRLAGRTWRVPDGATRTSESSRSLALATPEAFGPIRDGDTDGFSVLVLDVGGPPTPELMDQVRNAIGLVPNVDIYDGPSVGGMNQLDSVRSWIFAGAVLVLAIASLSVLVLAVEQVRTRRRPIAAMAASGIGFGTLARSLLWQNAIPFGIGALLAVGGGYLLAFLLVRIADMRMVSDWSALGVLFGSAGVLLLLVTALSLPMLRAAVSVKNLRTE